MGAKAGIDVEQLYRIVNGAAGASWMFTDRGKRMLSGDPEVNSALDIFVKDLDIVYAEAKKLMCPIPVASAALQQFISGQSLGLGKFDDSQVVKVYENITHVPVVSKTGATNEGTVSADVAFSNDFLQVFRVKNLPADPSECMSESQDKLRLNFDTEAIDVEVLKPTPIKQGLPLDISNHELLKSFEKIRVYKVTLEPSQSVTVTYPFFHLSAALTTGTIETGVMSSGEVTIQWTQTLKVGDLQWKEPCSCVKHTNIGDSVYQQYIIELI
jgi:hypothetical protein